MIAPKSNSPGGDFSWVEIIATPLKMEKDRKGTCSHYSHDIYIYIYMYNSNDISIRFY
jgi:hypothetical protein